MLGWSDHIKRKGLSNEVIDYIDEDIDRLKKVSERFSKIGSKVKADELKLQNLLKKEQLNYINYL